jgi:hypothetical protein
MTITGSSASTYSPYMEAVPYNYFVPRSNGDAVAVVPPSYQPYVIYDPSGAMVDEALDQRDAAERDAALAEERADYERMRADAAENNNAAANEENRALRDQLDDIQSQPPEDYVPPAVNNDDYIEPDVVGESGGGSPVSEGQTVEAPDNGGQDGGGSPAVEDNDQGGQNDASDNNDGGADQNEMMTHSLTLVLSAAGVGYLMVKAGLSKNALELKHRRRICPSCGRVISGRRCDAH